LFYGPDRKKKKKEKKENRIRVYSKRGPVERTLQISKSRVMRGGRKVWLVFPETTNDKETGFTRRVEILAVAMMVWGPTLE